MSSTRISLGLAVQGGVTALGVVEAEVAVQSGTKICWILVASHVDIFALHRPPEPLDADIVHPALLATHADLDVIVERHLALRINTIPAFTHSQGVCWPLASGVCSFV